MRSVFLSVAFPPLRPAAFFCAVVPPCLDVDREDDECDLSPPWREASGEFAIFAARSFDIPLSFSASYCFSFLTWADLPGIPASLLPDHIVGVLLPPPDAGQTNNAPRDFSEAASRS